MGHLDQNFELPLFSVYTAVLFNCVHSCRPFVAVKTSSAGLVGCRGFYYRPALVLDRWTPTTKTG